MAYGKTIELFLADGNANGLIVAELSNWNGKAVKVPRSELKNNSQQYIAKAGVYFLFCDSSDGVYIGEAENVYKRLIQHMKDNGSGKETYYWETAVVFTGSDLNKAHIRYLEDKLVKSARDCKRYKVLTKNTYSDTVLKESQIASMEEFIDNINVLINVLGYNVFTPLTKKTYAADQDAKATEYLYCKCGKGTAKGFLSEKGLTVLKGSRVSEHTVPSFEIRGKCYFNLRNRLEKDGTISNGVFQIDYEFKSPSAASAVVLGRNSNGNIDWKSAEGVPIKDPKK